MDEGACLGVLLRAWFVVVAAAAAARLSALPGVRGDVRLNMLSGRTCLKLSSCCSAVKDF